MILQKKVVELEKETESYHKKLTAQNNMVQEIKDESQKRAEKFQVEKICIIYKLC